MQQLEGALQTSSVYVRSCVSERGAVGPSEENEWLIITSFTSITKRPEIIYGDKLLYFAFYTGQTTD